MIFMYVLINTVMVVNAVNQVQACCLKQQKHGLDLTQCAVVGDRWTDIVAGAKVNATTILVRTGAGYDALHTYRDKWAHIEPNYIADNFEDATNWVLNQL